MTYDLHWHYCPASAVSEGLGGGLPSLDDPPSLDLSALHIRGEQDVSICELIDILGAFVLFEAVAVGGNGNYPLPCGAIPIISYSK